MRITRTQRRAAVLAHPRKHTRAHAAVTTAVTTAITTATLAVATVAAAPAASADTAAPVTSIITEDDGTVAVTLSGNTQPLWLKLSVRASTATDAPTLFSTEDGVDRFGLASRRPDALIELPAFAHDNLDPAGPLHRTQIQTARRTRRGIGADQEPSRGHHRPHP